MIKGRIQQQHLLFLFISLIYFFSSSPFLFSFQVENSNNKLHHAQNTESCYGLIQRCNFGVTANTGKNYQEKQEQQQNPTAIIIIIIMTTIKFDLTSFFPVRLH